MIKLKNILTESKPIPKAVAPLQALELQINDIAAGVGESIDRRFGPDLRQKPRWRGLGSRGPHRNPDRPCAGRISRTRRYSPGVIHRAKGDPGYRPLDRVGSAPEPPLAAGWDPLRETRRQPSRALPGSP